MAGNNTSNKNEPQHGVDVNELAALNSAMSSELTQNLDGKDAYSMMAAVWSVSSGLSKEIKNMNTLYSSSHGMFATIPIICRSQDCAYKDVCMVSANERIQGRRCPMEIAAIMARYEQYCKHFGIDISTGEIPDKDLVDATLVRDLVNVEIQQMRVENKVALNGDFMAKTLLDIDKKCNPYFGQIISPETEFMLTLQQRKEKILNQLNATRKDKASDKNKNNPSEDAAKMFKMVNEMSKKANKGKMENMSISDVEFDEDGNIITEAKEIESNESPMEINPDIVI